MSDEFKGGCLVGLIALVAFVCGAILFSGCSSTREIHVYQDKGHWMMLYENGVIQHHPGCHCGEDL